MQISPVVIYQVAALRGMHSRSNMLLITGLLVTAILLRPMLTSADSNIKSRPTRPNGFGNNHVLNVYLDIFKDYYNVNTKSRYGKRVGLLRSVIDTPDHWKELLRSKPNDLTRIPTWLKMRILTNRKKNRFYKSIILKTSII